MQKHFSSHKISIGIILFSFLILVFFITAAFVRNFPTSLTSSADLVCPSPEPGKKTLQLGTCYLATPTPTQISVDTIIPTTASGGIMIPPVIPGGGIKIPITTPIIGGPNHSILTYCIDDQDPGGCNDNSSFLVPKGSGGIVGTCGTVIGQAHKLVESLPHAIDGFRDSINPSVNNCGYSSGTYSSGYVSTYFIIDAYNLAGYKELSKSNPDNVSPASLLSWWKASPPGYTFIPYGPTVLQQYAQGQKDLTGCVLFFNLPSGNIHAGIVNTLEVYNIHGDGILSILQSGTNYFLDRFMVTGWNIQNTPLHQTAITGAAGFGCHN